MLLVATLVGALVAAAASAEEPVWFWLEECGGPELQLELRLDGELVQEAAFPICRRARSAKPARAFVALTFRFVAKRAIEWKGYREDSNVTPAGAEISIDVWQAGADEAHVTLGVSVEFENVLYMNTLHPALADKAFEQAIEPGLVLRTEPILRARVTP